MTEIEKRQTKNEFSIDISHLIYGETGTTETHSLKGKAEDFLEGEKTCSPLTGRVMLTKLDASIVAVLADIRVCVLRQCARCLTDFEDAITIPEAEREYGLIEGGEMDEASIDRERQTLLFNLNLDSFLREEVLVALTGIPHCRKDCKGLCPICGKNLNEGSCGHTPGIAGMEKATDTTTPFKDLKRIIKEHQAE